MSQPSNAEYFSVFETELQEILRHKYLASEKAGHDIGFERALKEWVTHYRQSWRETQGAGERG